MVKNLLVIAAAALIAVPAIAVADASDMSAARAAVAEMEKASNQVQNLLQTAKAQNDAIKVSCLSDKSTEIAGYVKGATETLGRAMGLQGAEAKAAAQSIEADAGTVERLRSEASGCVGVADASEAADSDEGGAEDALTSETRSSMSGSNLPTVRVPPPASPVL